MRVGLVSDIHWMAEPPASSPGWHGNGAEFRNVLDRLDEALALFRDAHVDAIALAGDLTHNGDDDSIIAVLRRCAGNDVPVLAVSGNHDVAGDPDRFGRALWRADAAGVWAPTLAGDLYGGIRVAGVQVGATDGWFGAHLAARPDVDDWGDEPVVLISHYPAISLASLVAGRGYPYPGDLVDRAALSDVLLARQAPTVVIGGHVHARVSAHHGPILQLTGGGLVEAPYECAVIDLRLERDRTLTITRDCHRLLPATGGREPVLAPEREIWRYRRGGWSSAALRAEEAITHH